MLDQTHVSENGNELMARPPRTVLMVGIMLLLISPAKAVYFYTGNEAYEFCFPEAAGPQYGQCVGYVAGLNDQSDVMMPGGIGCAPTGVALKQMVDVYSNFLRSHPELRHELASRLFNRAIMEAFPC